MELFFFFFLIIYFCVPQHACMKVCGCVYMCMGTMIGCHMIRGVYCLISVSAVSHPCSSVRSGPRRHLIAVAIVTLCVFLKPARSLVSRVDAFLHAWPAVCGVATCTLSPNGPVKKGFPVYYQKKQSSQRKHTNTIILTWFSCVSFNKCWTINEKPKRLNHLVSFCLI